MYINVADSQLG